VQWHHRSRLHEWGTKRGELTWEAIALPPRKLSCSKYTLYSWLDCDKSIVNNVNTLNE